MSIVHIIDTITDWARENICSKIKLKQPPGNDQAIDAGYAYTLVNPSAFPMYIPTADKLPKSLVSEYPCLCVRVFNVEDDLTANTGFADIQFLLCAWDPGLHGKDVYIPAAGGSYQRQADLSFSRDGSGWRDVWNFADIARRQVESALSIGEYTIDRQTPIKCEPVKEQEAIVDFWPFWYAVLSFRITYPLMRNNEDLEKYL